MKFYLIALALLAGCAPSAGERAEAAYQSSMRPGVSQHDQCRLARDAQFAYAGDGDGRRAGAMATVADMSCLAAATCESIPVRSEPC